MRVFLASNNSGKIEEMSNLLNEYEIISQSQIEKMIGYSLDIKENGNSFKDNAIIKVKTLYSALSKKLLENDIIIADDSGIVIPSLPNMLGVYTKRQMIKWCNKQDFKATERDFYNYISSITPGSKKCIFEVSIAVIKANSLKVYNEKLEGKLASSCRGSNGFGFDPIFEVNSKTLAQMSNDEKKYINPRAHAIKKVILDITK